MEKYKTGDVTISTHGAVRIYVNEDGVAGYFFAKNDKPIFILNPKGLDKVPGEPVVCTVEDVINAVLQTYGKEVR